jgi:hypothetical protein
MKATAQWVVIREWRVVRLNWLTNTAGLVPQLLRPATR